MKWRRDPISGRGVNVDNEGAFSLPFREIHRQRNSWPMEFTIDLSRDLWLLFRHLRLLRVFVQLVLTLRMHGHVFTARPYRHISVTIHVVANGVAVFRPWSTFGTRSVLRVNFRLFLLRVFIPVLEQGAFSHHRRYSLTVQFSATTFRSGQLRVSSLGPTNGYSLCQRIAHGRIVRVHHRLRPPPIRRGIVRS